MNVNEITALNELVADVCAIDGDDVSRIEIGVMADGSNRPFALVTTTLDVNEHEQVYRVALAASESAPRWAQVNFPHDTVEIRTGETWVDLGIHA